MPISPTNIRSEPQGLSKVDAFGAPRTLPLLVAILFLFATSTAQAQRYFPGPHGAWEIRQPGQVGIDATKLAEAVALAKASETTASRDLRANHYVSFGREPHGQAVGPHKKRGAMTGVIVHKGYIVAEWGEPHRVDMTFSVSKSFLSTTVGLAVDRGLIRDVDDTVGPYMATEHFDSPHNSQITWDHLLRQTSNWQGTLFGKPDWADRPPRDANLAEWRDRTRKAPGTSYKYNDVRVNLLALAALHVWREPLPQILRKHLMDPIGASNTWRWHGYKNSWITLDGLKVQSVSGGGHWGGGMFISARDLARFGYFALNRGTWNGRQLLADDWFTQALTQTGPSERGYGYMNYFLNHDGEFLPSAPRDAYAFLGNGTNMVYVDAENDLVVVARWIEGSKMDGVIAKVLDALH